MDNDNWDLHAVVRGCCAAINTTTTTASNNTVDLDSYVGLPSFVGENRDENFVGFSDHFEELHAICQPFLPNYQPPPPCSAASTMSASSLSSISAPEKKTQVVPEKRKIASEAVSFAKTATTTAVIATHSCASASAQPSRSKRRKNQHKRVCHVPADALSSDTWAWRKYGQKPIKGSPYPRGYYRCSTSKGCLARKQVERNRSDPTMFIVTYTGEHNHPAPTHRNSLAGSTRQKPNTTQGASGSDMPEKSSSAAGQQQQTSGPSPVNSVNEEQVMKTESVDDTVEDDDEHVDGSDTALSDDFFEGLEDFIGPVAGDKISDHFTADFGVNWAVNNTATAAGGC